ncbi:LacI family DNA-binding transcriptional regulator [Streptomyces sp. PT12]|uniref:LacI family DNA-binding transcriptional regulator n=1 Tax=Streptomyces sp. PT12 TaxID=1510197 RepID=UPI000DE21705|nr:LacI family DNA-binding transcriptional regulator [Streptomyces sp. PT12]RBM04867.1 hypothetical protein DEH69_29250 [Streptomyces sp. PT12]
MRSDAGRNRERLLDSAARLFAARGRGVRAGGLRGDLTFGDLPALVCGVTSTMHFKPGATKRTGRVTMQDAADRAGVSLATASFAINGKETTKVSAATRDPILAVAAELGYRPNAMAHGLSRASTSFIGLITDSIATTPFAGELIRGAQDAARERDHVLLIANTENDPRAVRDAVTMMLDHQVRGVVHSTWYHRLVRRPAGLDGVPLVLANCYTGRNEVQAFVPDEVAGGRSATALLLERGHRRVAFVNSDRPAPHPGRLPRGGQAFGVAGRPV